MSDEKKKIEVINWKTAAGDVDVKVQSNGFKVTTKQSRELLAEHGAGPEVVDQFMTAVSKVSEEGFEFLHEQTDPNDPGKQSKLILGDGNGRVNLALTPKHVRTVTDKDTGEVKEHTTFADAKLKVSFVLPKRLLDDDGVLAKIREDCEKRFSS